MDSAGEETRDVLDDSIGGGSDHDLVIPRGGSLRGGGELNPKDLLDVHHDHDRESFFQQTRLLDTTEVDIRDSRWWELEPPELLHVLNDPLLPQRDDLPSSKELQQTLTLLRRIELAMIGVVLPYAILYICVRRLTHTNRANFIAYLDGNNNAPCLCSLQKFTEHLYGKLGRFAGFPRGIASDRADTSCCSHHCFFLRGWTQKRGLANRSRADAHWEMLRDRCRRPRQCSRRLRGPHTRLQKSSRNRHTRVRSLYTCRTRRDGARRAK